ncbi:hypothetical protein SUGI_0211680 [Cryptomeria japonica]|nr:hypothetical protein SUGI_0211680 [Cryptomeria japonica]
MVYDVDDIKLIFAPCALIVCMVWDILMELAKDYVKLSSWLPNNLFVLSALTVEILGYIDIQKVNLLDPSSPKDLGVLVDDQLKMDAARLTMCVFLGCLLPGMAMAGTNGRWSNIAALFLSLSFHIGTEIYAMQNHNGSEVGRESGLWFVSSGLLLLVGASSLLLLLGAVILSGKLAHDGVRSDIVEKLGKDVENEGFKQGSLRSEVMESWVAVRAWKTLYFLSSSAFSPGAAMIVTICVAFMAAKMDQDGAFLCNFFRERKIRKNNGFLLKTSSRCGEPVVP